MFVKTVFLIMAFSLLTFNGFSQSVRSPFDENQIIATDSLITSGQAPRLSVAQVISGSRNYANKQKRDQALIDGVSSAVNADDVIRLAGNCYYAKNGDAVIVAGLNIAKNIDDILALANKCRFAPSKDAVLRRGMDLAKSIPDFVRLATNVPASSGIFKDEILVTGSEKATDVSDIVDLALHASAVTRDNILLSGLKLAHFENEFQRLANNAHSPEIRNYILSQRSSVE
ncbi:MAG: hypothetical protein HQM10_00075 [Candidatus Riflebacteria bacterium]|nr:hypothetical protein [Candidatus Riflebacteria bacterium]